LIAPPYSSKILANILFLLSFWDYFGITF